MIQLPQQYEWLLKEGSPKMLTEALKIYGTKEDLSVKSNPTILGWAKELGLDGVYNTDSIAWCGLAMAVIAKRAGKEIPQAPLWALNWAKFGTPVSTPMLGDVLVFKRMVGKKTFGHVAIYVGEDNTCYHILGGNQSDRVCIVRKAKTSLFVARRPIYSIATPANVRRVFLSSKGALSTKED